MRAIENRRGSMLIVALWTVSILSLLAAAAGVRAWLEIRLVRGQIDRMREERLVAAAAALARRVLPPDGKSVATLKDPWADDAALFRDVRLEEGTFSIVKPGSGGADGAKTVYGLEDDGDRVNLNTVGADALRSLMPDADPEVPAAVARWRQASAPALSTADDDDYYSSLPHPYPRKRADYESVEELLLVRGMTPELYAALASLVTVYSRRVNINTATPRTLAALGLGPSLVGKILAFRAGAGTFAEVSAISQNLSLTPQESAQLAAAAPFLATGSQAFRMDVEVWPGDAAERGRPPARYEVVLQFLTRGRWIIKHCSRA